ncbi:hypothetical protein VTN77DRAFT_2965 [Rasamsonia byssochlamydoides]|uniref:uncharacterized protein n=1 Tax=Rasamsonia byssochlamydoides TaxID=89139 RepID=UPI003743864D
MADTHRAIILPAVNEPLSLQSVPTPTPQPGQVLVKPLAVPIVGYTRDVLTGKRPYPLPVPFTPGVSSIARVEATGPDAVSLKPGQLVYVDTTVRARDYAAGEKGACILQGFMAGTTPEARHLAEHAWKHGSWAERQIVPLENVHVLDEEVLLHQKGYRLSQLTWINALLVPYGGWLAAGLQPGETAIVCFATGHFGARAIDVALAMGAGRVVGVGRRIEALKAVQARYPAGKVSVVAITGNKTADAAALRAATPRGGAGADCYLDLSPPMDPALASSHIQSAIAALKVGGRAVLMGGIADKVSLPYGELMFRNITVRGNFMYGQDAPAKLIRMIESGNLSLGHLDAEEFRFEEYEKAIDAAARERKEGSQVVLRIQE